jgi:hypothetical protein
MLEARSSGDEDSAVLDKPDSGHYRSAAFGPVAVFRQTGTGRTVATVAAVPWPQDINQSTVLSSHAAGLRLSKTERDPIACPICHRECTDETY